MNRRELAKALAVFAFGASSSASAKADEAHEMPQATPTRYLAVYNGNDVIPGQRGGDLGVATGADPRFFGRRGIISPRAEQTVPFGNEKGKRLACPVRVGNEIFVWYEGYDGTRWQIFLETFDLDLNLRYAHPVPVLRYTEVTGASSVERPCVLYEPQDTAAPFKMVFSRAISGINGIALLAAISLNGVEWTVLGEMVGLGSGWESAILNSSGRLINDNGVYRLFYSGTDGTPGRWRSGEMHASSFGTTGWTKHPSNPLIKPRGQAKQLLSATSVAGSRSLKVDSTLLYDRGAPIVVWYDQRPAVYEFNIVEQIISDTEIKCRYPWQGTYTHDDKRNGLSCAAQVHSASVDITEVWKEDGKWKCLFTCFGFIPSFGLETTGYAETDDLDRGFTIDPTVWPLPMLNKRAVWDRTSAENVKFIRLP